MPAISEDEEECVETVTHPGRLTNQLVTGVNEKLQLGAQHLGAHPRETRLPEGHPGNSHGVDHFRRARTGVRVATAGDGYSTSGPV